MTQASRRPRSPFKPGAVVLYRLNVLADRKNKMVVETPLYFDEQYGMWGYGLRLWTVDGKIHYKPLDKVLFAPLHKVTALDAEPAPVVRVPLPSFQVETTRPGDTEPQGLTHARGYESAYHAAQWVASCVGDGPVRKVREGMYKGKRNRYTVTQLKA